MTRMTARPHWAALAIVVTACGTGAAGAGPDEMESARTAPRVVNVEVLAVQPEPFEDLISITGTVEAERDVTVAAEESGVIREVFVEKGRSVRAGQAIARIDDRVLRAQYDQARSEAALARETFERQRRLWEDERIGSEMNYLRARYGAETAEASVRMLAARLDRTVVRAPISGMLDARMVEIGSMVGPGTPIARIIDVDTLKVTGGVPERYAGEIRGGADATITFETMSGVEFSGRCRFVGASVNEHNRTFPVEVAIPNAGGMLKPGMVARVKLARGRTEQALIVPREAVLRAEHGYIVYTVVEQDGRRMAQATPVTPGAGAGNRVVIDAGLMAGDRVVIVGQHQVAAGDLVQVVQAKDGGS
jgi:membrane fusion protein, multidrug efflux system